MFLPVAQQLERIRDGVDAILPEDELERKLQRSRERDEPLVIKQGFDPTRPDLHIGHAVSLRKLRDFQEFGHRVVFVIGDYTARIGDPSGRSDTRPVLDEEEIEANLETYRKQVSLVLDPERTEMRRNGEWLGPLRLADILRLTSMYTVARMLEREDFARRHGEGRPIALSEFLYPMMQAYDSVELRADVELGGTDQRFNLLLGRTIQEKCGQEPQVCIIMPLLRGTDGQRKMSKSYDNYVGLAMQPEQMFGRTMSVPDELLEEWLRLASSAGGDALRTRLQEAAADPLAAKRWLATDLVAQYHGSGAADAARDAFDRVHRRGEAPEELPLQRMGADEGESALWIGYALQRAGLADSTSEALRMIDQGAVQVDGRRVSDRDLQLEPGRYLLQRGKRRFARVQIEASTGSD